MKAEAPKTQKQETTEEGADVTHSGKENTATASSEITEEEQNPSLFRMQV